ncbi:hypothetical protein DPX16_12834 [Anabarilius grahami]|uniref:C2 domain-containing protein n=1 Tax=Anabarilius grahami TaxID=495550 RepID=A0A3N0XD06_ANAGA|nr:hypothetical protein DPX16_12834 [Anabarilius grahami]
MAVFHDLQLMSLAVLMLASQLDVVSAAVRVSSLYGRGLTGDPFGNAPDPYVKVWCGSTFAGQTEYLKDNAYPRWSAEFNFPKCKANDNLKIEMWDRDEVYDDLLGTFYQTLQNGVSNPTYSLSAGTLTFNLEVK